VNSDMRSVPDLKS